MRKFFVSLAVILTVSFALDRLGGEIMWWVNQHTHDVSGPKINYLVKGVHEDILLLGTSRCNYHYVPSIIQDSLKMSVYNGGIDASSNIYAHFIVLNHVLSSFKPKVICLEIMTNEFNVQANPFKTITFFAPYFGLNAIADSVFLAANNYWGYRVSHLYRYNARAVSNIAGLLVDRQKEGEGGYLPLREPNEYPYEIDFEYTPEAVDSMKIDYVHRFIDTCRSNGVELVFMVSPRYSEVAPDHYDVIKKMALEEGVPFMDYHTRGLFLDHPEYFRDKSHLWDAGARQFSSIFAHDLKMVLDTLSLN